MFERLALANHDHNLVFAGRQILVPRFVALVLKFADDPRLQRGAEVLAAQDDPLNGPDHLFVTGGFGKVPISARSQRIKAELSFRSG